MAQILLRDYLQETEDAISSKRIDEAFANCQYVLAYFPESLDAQRLLGEVYLAQGRLEDARNSFDWVLTNDPENVLAYCSRALVSERMSDYDTALDCYQQAYELSRGNGQIRQAFNELSVKAGQSGFMFSRAGLARLYMRGNLLPQSVLEWDIVLSVTPDRLDARTGLLEAYWRQGLNDRVSPLAEQILQDVPGCVKALLLLAHVTAPQNMLRSRDLIQRVGALDPDFQMAKDLFADQIAHQPDDPFLKLFDRPGAMIGEPDRAAPAQEQRSAPVQEQSSAPVPSAQEEQHSTPPAQKQRTRSGSGLLSQWGGKSWSGEESLPKPDATKTSTPDVAAASVSSTANAQAPSWMSDAAFGLSHYSNAGQAAADPSSSSVSNSSLSNSFMAPSSGTGASSQPATASSDLSSNLPSNLPSDLSSWSSGAWSVLPQQSAASDQLGAEQSSDNQTAETAPAASHDSLSLSGISGTPSAAPGDFSTPAGPSASGQGSNWDLNASSQASATPPSDQATSSPDFSGSFSGISGADSPVSGWPLPVSEPDNAPAPPPWLSMLKQSEPAQPETSHPGEAEPFTPPSTSEPAPAPTPVPPVIPEETKVTQNVPDTSPVADTVQNEEPSSTDTGEDLAASDDDDDSFFGPAWLRSLGAMDEPGADNATPADASPSDSDVSTPGNVSVSADEENKSPQSSPSLPVAEPPVEPEPPAEPEPSVEPELPAADTSSPAFNMDNMDWQSQLEDSNAGSIPAAPAPSSWWEESSQQYDPFAGTGMKDMYQQPAAGPAQPQEDVAAPQPTEAEPAASADEDPWAKLSQQVQDKSIDYAWLEQLAVNNQPAASAGDVAQSEPAENAVSQPPADDHVEQHVVTTLEELDQRLRSSGFVTLEPNSLASIAHDTESTPSTDQTTPEIENPGAPDEGAASTFSQQSDDEKPAEPAVSQQPPASAEPYSAFAELSSSYQPQSTAEPDWLTALSASASSSLPPIVDPVSADAQDDSWAQLIQQPEAGKKDSPLQTAPAPAASMSNPGWPEPVVQPPVEQAPLPARPEPVVQPPIEQMPQPVQPQQAVRSPQMPPAQVPPIIQPQRIAQPEPAVQTPDALERTIIQTPPPARRRPVTRQPSGTRTTPPAQIQPSILEQAQQAQSLPVARPKPRALPNELELETTMKRPAIRLQPMKQHNTLAQSQPLQVSPAAQVSSSGQEYDGRHEGDNYQDHLVHGYQAQLIGDYDNAMQEYRLIIRNAPELLGEVVSNLRALLKLAPKYSAGYRVLGDAYMRQGEYLQAMEAYNKALTMAKKARR